MVFFVLFWNFGRVEFLVAEERFRPKKPQKTGGFYSNEKDFDLKGSENSEKKSQMGRGRGGGWMGTWQFLRKWGGVGGVV